MAYTYTPYEKKEYQQSDSVNQAQQALRQHQQNKPAQYQSQYQQGMNDIMNQYQNRGPFNYDINSDAMYQQMVDRYIQMGKQGMMDTMGQAAAMTGGYGNSWAQTAGQQTYQNYLQGANDMLPQFYQMALDRYQMQGEDLLSQYNLLANQENMDYNRYMDQLNQYYAELDRLRSAYESERNYDYSRFTDDQAFDYGRYMDDQNYQYQLDRDQTEDQRWADQWARQQERDRIQDEQWQKQYDESIRQYNEQMAWDQEQFNRLHPVATGGDGGGSSGGGGGTSNYKKTEDMLENGGYSSAQMLQIIKTSPLTEKQQQTLINKYQQPKQKEEVNKRDPKKDNSAFWSR